VFTFAYDKLFVLGSIEGENLVKGPGGAASYTVDTINNQITLFYGGDLTSNLKCQLLLAIKP
jgi:hypothetical protein